MATRSNQKQQFVFGNVIVYSDSHLIARRAYEEVLRQKPTENRGTVIVDGREIRWERLPSKT